MRWHDLLFMHWPVPADLLRPLLPPGLELDTYGSEAWIGVVPFRMTGIRPRYTPTLPWISAFVELNVRTYVTRDGKPGVWFFSLDAANPVAVRMARWQFHLPYFDARMRSIPAGDGMHYASARTHRGAPAATFTAHYRPTGDVYRSRPGDLDHWLTERYCLYSADARGQIHRGDIHHAPWPLQHAEAEIETNTMTDWLGIDLPDTAPLLHFARRLEVVAWLLRPA
jgi:uncharacterized protein YqjF (DUF2071 family)